MFCNGLYSDSAFFAQKFNYRNIFFIYEKIALAVLITFNQTHELKPLIRRTNDSEFRCSINIGTTPKLTDLMDLSYKKCGKGLLDFGNNEAIIEVYLDIANIRN